MKRIILLKNLQFHIYLLLSIIFSIPIYGQSQYIKKYSSLADTISQKYGIPKCVILGIATVESSSGSGRIVKLLNNHFGIVGKNNLLKTKGIKTRYKQYPNDKASFIDFAEVISRKKYYPKMKDNKSCQTWINEISKYGYSEKPEIWRKRVMDVINKNKL